MNKKLSIKFDHRIAKIKYRERLVYNILDENDNQLLRVAVHIANSGNKLQIFSAGIRTDAPLPEGISSKKYLEVLNTFKKKGDLRDISYLSDDRPNEYASYIKNGLYILTSSAEDSELEDEIAKWLQKSIDMDSMYNKIMNIFDSIRNETATAKEQKIVPESGEKSTGGVEDDII